MCGLVSVASVVNICLGVDQRELFTSLMIINQLRGRDSTGVFKINNKSEVDWIKQKGGPEVLFAEDVWKSRFKNQLSTNTVFVAGHGRYGTSGGSDSDSAHPFTEKTPDGQHQITLIHNGTLHYLFDRKLPVRTHHMVDSHWLTKCFAEVGAVETLGMIGGAAALIWWDSKEKTMNYYRNTERPLYYAIVAGAKFEYQLIATSEEASLLWAQRRFGLRYVGDKTHALKEHTIHRISYDGLPEEYDPSTGPWSSEEFVPPRVVSPTPVVTYNSRWAKEGKEGTTKFSEGHDNIDWTKTSKEIVEIPSRLSDKISRGKTKILKFLGKKPHAKELGLIASEIFKMPSGIHDFIIPAWSKVHQDVKHIFTINPLHEIISYENSADGSFMVSERVRMKIDHCVEIEGRPGWSQVFADRQRTGKDIGVIFTWIEKTTDALALSENFANPYWECDIREIRLARQSIHETTGKVVEIFVDKKYRLYEGNAAAPLTQ